MEKIAKYRAKDGQEFAEMFPCACHDLDTAFPESYGRRFNEWRTKPSNKLRLSKLQPDQLVGLFLIEERHYVACAVKEVQALYDACPGAFRRDN